MLYSLVCFTINDVVMVLYILSMQQVSGWKEDEDGEGGESGTVFEDVDLTDKEWADYDDRYVQPILEG